MEIIIDNREKAILSIIDKEKIQLQTKNLEIGDIHLYYNQKLQYIIERKTLSDLAASIKDGRYKEQKVRLYNQNCEIIYIIEGYINSYNRKKKVNGIYGDTILGCITGMLLRDNIKIFISKNAEETCLILYKLINKIPEYKKKDLDSKNVINQEENENKTEDNIEYVKNSMIKTKKRDNILPKDMLLYQLAQIPGISVNIATSISKKYPSMMLLCEALNSYTEEDNGNKDKSLFLSEIEMDLSTGKKRKIGKVLSKRIYECLHGGNI
jgi:crossover junction endonuclease MUS81